MQFKFLFGSFFALGLLTSCVSSTDRKVDVHDAKAKIQPSRSLAVSPGQNDTDENSVVRIVGEG